MDEIELQRQLEKIHDMSYGWALNCCSRDRSEAKDVLQMAYLKVLQGKAAYKGSSSLKTGFFSVIRYTAAEERRRHWFRRLGLAKFAEEKRPDGFFSEEHSSDDQEESSRALKDSLSRLPRRQQEVLHLVFYQEMTLQEAAAVMGVSIGSARTHYERGKGSLRKLLRDKGAEAQS